MVIKGQRARRAEDKEARRRAFRAAARDCFAERAFSDVKMAEVARRAGLAKGTLFLYFETKEALFLDVLEEELEAWLDVVDEALAQGRGRWTQARVARLIADSLLDRELFTRLLTLLSGVLEHNVSVERVIAFKRHLVNRLGHSGSVLERRLKLPQGTGQRLLLRVYALVIGVRQLTDPGPAARVALHEPELASLVLSFDDELRSSLIALMRGMEREEER